MTKDPVNFDMAEVKSWFDLKKTAKCSAKCEGWNSKTYWITRGLDKITSNSIISWTKKSLLRDTIPLPRKNDFRFENRVNAESRGETEEGPTNEAGINWNLFDFMRKRSHNLTDKSCPSFIPVYEFPLVAGRKGQLLSDFILFSKNNTTGHSLVELVELKRESANDTPLMAFAEAVCYIIQLLRCWELPGFQSELKTVLNKATHDDVIRYPDRINLVLAAPQKYWQNCMPNDEFKQNESAIKKRFDEIIQGVNGVVNKKIEKMEMQIILADCKDNGASGLTARKYSHPLSPSVFFGDHP